jgi:hypothetical protein
LAPGLIDISKALGNIFQQTCEELTEKELNVINEYMERQFEGVDIDGR